MSKCDYIPIAFFPFFLRKEFFSCHVPAQLVRSALKAGSLSGAHLNQSRPGLNTSYTSTLSIDSHANNASKVSLNNHN